MIKYLDPYLISSWPVASLLLTDIDGAVRVQAGKHAERLDGPDKLVVGVGDHATLVEDTLDGLGQPLAVGLLAAHEEANTLLDGLHIGVFALQEAQDCPGRLHDQRTRRVLHIRDGLAGLANC